MRETETTSEFFRSFILYWMILILFIVVCSLLIYAVTKPRLEESMAKMGYEQVLEKHQTETVQILWVKSKETK